jgi:integrase
MTQMTRLRLQFVNEFRDRHGKVRRYLRRPGCKAVPLPGLPGSAEFMAAYQAALTGVTALPKLIGEARTVAGTVQALVAAYLDYSPGSTSPFKTLAAETQRTRRNILENFREAHGEKRVFRTEANGRRILLLTREHMQKIINEKAVTPFAQRNLLNTLRALFRWAVEEGRVPDDPTLGVKRVKLKTTGYKTWSESDIEIFEQKHAVGTRARLAFGLFLYTGQRRGDVMRLGRQHIRHGVLTIDQRKTEGQDEAHLEIPVHPKLREIIDATPNNHLTFLTTRSGMPFSPAGLTNWFREMCNEAGLPNGLSAHGLRKACARRLADIGCTTHEIAAITGHATLAEVERYTRAANRKRLGQSAMKKLIEHGA